MRINHRVPRRTADISRGVVSHRRFWKNTVRIAAFFVALYLVLTWGSTLLVTVMPLSWVERIEASPPSSWTRDELPPELRRIFNRVVQSSDTPRRIELYVDRSDASNAFALLGGHLALTRGLLETVRSEEELAFVIAHEIGHFENRHPLKSVSRTAVLSLAKLLLFGNNDMAVISLSENLAELSHSRGQERAADRCALGCLQTAYGHVGGATSFFESMLEQSRWHPPALLSTHPLPDSRIEAIQDLIAERGLTARELTPLNLDLDMP